MKLLISKERYPRWMSLRMTKKYPPIIWRIMRLYYKKKGYKVERINERIRRDEKSV